MIMVVNRSNWIDLVFVYLIGYYLLMIFRMLNSREEGGAGDCLSYPFQSDFI